ncbi:MAG: hypothetical protein WAW61_07900, partial [Methylococcaceae bacterium]
ALANVSLFMWEYNKGAFVPVIEASQQNAHIDQEPILLVSELKKDSPEPGTAIFPSVLDSLDNKRRPLQNVITEIITSPEAMLNPVEQKQKVVENKLLPLEQHGLNTAILEKTASIVQVEKVEENSKISEKTPTVCYEAGPFTDDGYAAWRNQLSVAEGAIQSFSRDEQTISSYLVYYPAAKTLMESEANVQMLKDNGINDLWLFRTGGDKGQISIGVFKNENRALMQQSRMLARGIKVEVKARYKTKTQRYAQVKSNGKALKSLNKLQKANPGFTVKQVDSCL